MELNNVKGETSWGEASSEMNHNNRKIANELFRLDVRVESAVKEIEQKVDDVSNNNKGIFGTLSSLNNRYPKVNNRKEWYAFVGSSNPREKYIVKEDGGHWIATGDMHNVDEVSLHEYSKSGGSTLTMKRAEERIEELETGKADIDDVNFDISTARAFTNLLNVDDYVNDGAFINLDPDKQYRFWQIIPGPNGYDGLKWIGKLKSNLPIKTPLQLSLSFNAFFESLDIEPYLSKLDGEGVSAAKFPLGELIKDSEGTQSLDKVITIPQGEYNALVFELSANDTRAARMMSGNATELESIFLASIKEVKEVKDYVEKIGDINTYSKHFNESGKYITNNNTELTFGSDSSGNWHVTDYMDVLSVEVEMRGLSLTGSASVAWAMFDNNKTFIGTFKPIPNNNANASTTYPYTFTNRNVRYVRASINKADIGRFTFVNKNADVITSLLSTIEQLREKLANI